MAKRVRAGTAAGAKASVVGLQRNAALAAGE